MVKKLSIIIAFMLAISAIFGCFLHNIRYKAIWHLILADDTTKIEVMKKSFLFVCLDLFNSDGQPKEPEEINKKQYLKIAKVLNKHLKLLPDLHNDILFGCIFDQQIESSINPTVVVTKKREPYAFAEADGAININIGIIQFITVSSVMYVFNQKYKSDDSYHFPNVIKSFIEVNKFEPPLSKTDSIKAAFILKQYVDELVATDKIDDLKNISVNEFFMNVFWPMAIDFIGQKLFLLAHEIGHIKLKHHEFKKTSATYDCTVRKYVEYYEADLSYCEIRKYIEYEADAYAAIIMARFLRMGLSDVEKNRKLYGLKEDPLQNNEILRRFEILTMLGHFQFFNVTYEVSGIDKIDTTDKCGYPDFKGRASYAKQISQGYSMVYDGYAHYARIREILMEELGTIISERGWNKGRALLKASKEGDIETIKKLFKDKVDINYQNRNGFDALSYAVERGHFEVIKLLIKNGAKTNGYTPLMKAARGGSYRIFNFLISKGACTEFKDSHGKNLFMNAVLGKNINIINYLIEDGTDINSKTEDGKTALHLLMEDVDGCYESEGTIEVIEFLIENGISINEKNSDGQTAIFYGSPKTIEFLIQKGIDVDSRDKNDSTPLMYAVQSPCIERVNVMIKEGADVNATDKNNVSVLAHCENYSFEYYDVYGSYLDDIEEKLLKHGAEKHPTQPSDS